jgi:phospholipase C
MGVAMGIPCLLAYRNIARDARYTRHIRTIFDYKTRAQEGRLPFVSWIDPNFVDYPLGGPANDDHPDADMKDGQIFTHWVYDALSSGPLWSRSMLVITYDEHGGFYDHVPPPQAPEDRRPPVGPAIRLMC